MTRLRSAHVMCKGRGFVITIIMEEVVRFLLDLGYDVRFVTVCVQVAS